MSAYALFSAPETTSSINDYSVRSSVHSASSSMTTSSTMSSGDEVLEFPDKFLTFPIYLKLIQMNRINRSE